MKNMFLGILCVVAAGADCLFAQTSTTGGSTSSRSTTGGRSSSTRSGSGSGGLFGRDENSDNNEDRTSQVNQFVGAIIGGMLRNPNPRIRVQAIRSLVGGMTSNTGTNNSDTNNSGISGIFNTNNNSDSNDSGATSAGPVVFVPDLFGLLSDPNPEVRDMASVGLDMLFGTDVTLMRLMDDEDQLMRKYAVKVYAMKTLSAARTGTTTGTTTNTAELYELLALRTLLVKLKNEKDPEIRQIITDALDQYSKSKQIGGAGGAGGPAAGGNPFGMP